MSSILEKSPWITVTKIRLAGKAGKHAIFPLKSTFYICRQIEKNLEGKSGKNAEPVHTPRHSNSAGQRGSLSKPAPPSSSRGNTQNPWKWRPLGATPDLLNRNRSHLCLHKPSRRLRGWELPSRGFPSGTPPKGREPLDLRAHTHLWPAPQLHTARTLAVPTVAAPGPLRGSAQASPPVCVHPQAQGGTETRARRVGRHCCGGKI